MRKKEPTGPETAPEAHEGWFFLRPDAVPHQWRNRAVPVLLVPLLPGEAGQLLGGGESLPEIDPEQQRLVGLVARGLSTAAIAHELGITRRSVERRLASLRERLGVRSTAELAALLSRQGF